MEQIQMTKQEFENYGEAYPINSTIFAAFTSLDRHSLFSSDRIIREMLAYRYGIKPHEAFSHCGIILKDDLYGLMFAEETYPTYEVVPWVARKKDVILQIDSCHIIKHAKKRIFENAKNRPRYSLLHLASLALTELTFGLIKPPEKAGQVCSRTMARELTYFDSKPDKFFEEVDPVQLYRLTKPFAVKQITINQ